MKKILNPLFREQAIEKFETLSSSGMRWSNLGVFGNSTIGKLVVLAPVIAQAVRYSSDFFEFQLGITNVIFLYWSLIFISIGQILYLWQCPTEIKKYGKDVTLYKIESLQALHKYGFAEIHNHWLKTWFNNANHKKGFETPSNPKTIRLDLPKFTSRAAAEKHALVIISGTGRKDSEQSISNEKLADNYWCFCKNVTDYFCHPNIDWKAVNILYQHHSELFGVQKNQTQSSVTPITSRMGEGKDDETMWRTEALSWYISKLDYSKPLARKIIAAFYVLGSLYFAWHIPKNILEMAVYSFRNIF